jgi:hypothetical protein
MDGAARQPGVRVASAGVGMVRRRIRRAFETAFRRPRLEAAERAGLTALSYWRGYGYPPPPANHGLPDDAFIVAPARHQIVFRLVGRAATRRRDFESNRDKGRPQAPDETYADYLGVSVFSHPDLAVANAVRWPKHVARVLLPEGDGFSIARTYPDIRGHYTIWGDPDRLLANAERVDTHYDPDTLEEA